MKRCPQCNRSEDDDTLTFCRADGTPLVRELGAASDEAGTRKFSPMQVSDTSETRILPTDEPLNRPTAGTTVLDTRQSSRNKRGLSKPKPRNGVIVAAAIAAIALAASAYIYLSRGKGRPTIDSIAVLPFANESGNADAEYLSDGIAESLINSLSRLTGLRVIARTTTFSYKGGGADPRVVGRELGVDAVLTGRVVQRGDGLSVQTDLISVADGVQLWGKRYDRKLADIVSVQQEITRDIYARMRQRLTGEEHEQSSKRYTDNAEAYQLYLRGRFLWNKRNPEAIGRAVEHFRRAIELDPDFALAHAALADCYAVPSSGLWAEERWPKAREAATRALELDDALAEAYASLGAVKHQEWDWAGAESDLRRAIELNPNYATARQWYAELLNDLGGVQEALAEIRRAQELDPLSPIIHSIAGVILVSARQYDQAIAEFRKALDLDIDLRIARISLMRTYEWKGMYEEMFAEAETDTALRRDPQRRTERERMVATLRTAYRVGGGPGFRRKLLEFQMGNRDRRSPQAGTGAAEIAESYAVLGNKDQAFEWLNKAFEEHDSGLPSLKNNPDLDSLRSDARFADLLRRMGLPR